MGKSKEHLNILIVWKVRLLSNVSAGLRNSLSARMGTCTNAIVTCMLKGRQSGTYYRRTFTWITPSGIAVITVHAQLVMSKSKPIDIKSMDIQA